MTACCYAWHGAQSSSVKVTLTPEIEPLEPGGKQAEDLNCLTLIQT